MLTRRALLGVCVAMGAAISVQVPSVLATPKVSFAIIMAKDSPVSELSFGDLKRLYRGEAVRVSETDLKPLALAKGSPERAAFDQLVMGMDEDTAARYWIDRKIRGQTGAPKGISSPQILIRVVGQVPGAVGYVPTAEVNAQVKVLRIDGRMPHQPGYRVGG